MIEPLALVVYEKLLPGTQLVNRLQDLKYRVHTVSDAEALPEIAEEIKPLVAIVDLEWSAKDVFGAISRLRQKETTKHLPVIGFSRDNGQEVFRRAESCGATLNVSDAVVLNYLPQLLEQALGVD